MFGGGGGGSSESGSILPTSFQDEPACADMCPNLSYKHRIMGYAACSGLGFLLSLVGTFILFGGTSAANIRIFAVLYVFGNIIALCATGFLLGPRKQCIKMWLPTRRWSTAFYLLMIIIVFIVAMLKQNVFLVLFLLGIEIIAGLWYSISYIPFARKIVITFFRSLGICYPCFYVHDGMKAVYEKNFKSTSSSSNSMTNVFSGNTSNKASSGSGMFGSSANNNAKTESSSSFWGSS